jgi:hypothetical protein
LTAVDEVDANHIKTLVSYIKRPCALVPGLQQHL